MDAELQLSLLGKLQINRAGTPVTGFVSAKAQALLCYLAVTGRPHDRQILATLLWGERAETEAKANLRTVLFNLRKLVGVHLEINREAIGFNYNSSYWLDVELFEKAVAATGALNSVKDSQTAGVFKTPAVLLSPLAQAVELYQGNFLEGFVVREAPTFEEWLFGQRERLRHLAIQALYTLAIQHTAQGEYAAGIDYTTRLLALEPWQEEGHRQMMILLARSGQRSAALAQYETCRRILAEELGVEPAAETEALYQRLKAAGTPRSHNLPPQATPFVGRQRELAQLAEYISQPTCRLVSLIGLGGVGKTRLALQAAADNLLLFQDGVFFVSLAAVASPETVMAHIVAALNLSLNGPAEPKVQLLNYLRTKELWLILDNYEQLLPSPAGGALLTDLLQAAPRLKLLVTSRERLNLQEEWVIEVEGLEYPGSDSETQRREADSRLSVADYSVTSSQTSTPLKAGGTNLQSYSAVALFLQQAQRVRADFALTEKNEADVIRLCHLMQGIPLGLELAATWLPMLTCGGIVAEIKRDLDFLATSLRNVPERHRSMRAVFESSWNLLPAVEREVLKRLSVFRGGFQREAAVQVTGATLPALFELLNKSLLHRNAAGRYDMHGVIQQFAAEKLAQTPSEQEEIQTRHSVYYAKFVQQRQQFIYSPKQLDTAREIGAEFENIQAVWQRAVEREQIDLIDQCLQGLGFFYEVRCLHHQGFEAFAEAAERLRLERNALTSSAETERGRVYAQLLAQQALFALLLTRFELARKLLQESQRILRGLDAPQELGFALQLLGWVALLQGDYATAEQQLKESRVLGQASGNAWLAAVALALLGWIAYARGDYRQAERRLRRSMSVLRQLDRLWWATLLPCMSNVISIRGELAEAQQLLEEGLAASREISDQWGTAACLTQLAVVLSARGETAPQEAKQLVQESLAIFRAIATPWGLTNTLNQLGQLHCSLGEYDEAQPLLQEALQVAYTNQLRPVALDVLVSLAELRWRMSPPEVEPAENKHTVLNLLTLALNHSACEQVVKDRAARLLAELEANLPRPVVKAALEQDQARDLDVVATQILEQLNPSEGRSRNTP